MVALADLADAVGARTRVVACSHVSWVAGEMAPAALAQVDVPVVLDGAQGAGAVPVDVAALGCDAYAAAGQKWLCGPDGTGMLYVSRALCERVRLVTPSFTSFRDPSRCLESALSEAAERLDTPSLAREAAAFARAALAVLEEPALAAVHARARELTATLAEGLAERGRAVAARGETTLVSWEEADPAAARTRLADSGVVVRDLPDRPYLRASVGAWNDERDLERLLDALP